MQSKLFINLPKCSWKYQYDEKAFAAGSKKNLDNLSNSTNISSGDLNKSNYAMPTNDLEFTKTIERED